jgi:hypothetical protein
MMHATLPAQSTTRKHPAKGPLPRCAVPDPALRSVVVTPHQLTTGTLRCGTRITRPSRRAHPAICACGSPRRSGESPEAQVTANKYGGSRGRELMDSPMDKIHVSVEAVQSLSLTSLRLKTLTMCTRSRHLGCRPPFTTLGTAPLPPAASVPRLHTKDTTHLLRGAAQASGRQIRGDSPPPSSVTLHGPAYRDQGRSRPRTTEAPPPRVSFRRSAPDSARSAGPAPPERP